MRTRFIIAAITGLISLWTVAPASALPVINVNPSSHDFGVVAVSQTGGPFAFTATNTGTDPLTISAVNLTGANASQYVINSNGCSSAPIAPEGTCQVSVSFKPTVIANPVPAGLTFVSNASEGSVTVGLDGVGRWYHWLAFNPEQTDFGQTLLNAGPSPSQTITVTAMGATPFTYEEVRLYSYEFEDYSITSDTCEGKTVNPGDTCQVSVAFDPSVLGERKALLRFDTGPLVAITLMKGIGVDAGFTLTPAAQDFGTRPINSGPGAPSAFKLTSTGTTDLEVGEVALGGAAAGQFGITADACSNKVLAPATSCEISAAFNPTTAGEKVAALSVPMNARLVGTSQLTGSGQAPVPPPNPCEPVAVKNLAYFTPRVKRPSSATGVRARLTTAGPAAVRISSKVIYHLNGRKGSVSYGQRQFEVKKDSVDYKVAIPKRLRGKLEPGKQVRFVITYSSKAASPECTEFGGEKTRSLTTRIVKVIPNG